MNDITIFIFGLSFAAVVGATFIYVEDDRCCIRRCEETTEKLS